jgi:hypothetical protein
MVLCGRCHSQISRIHHAGKANHRGATQMVMGHRYEIWNAWQRFKWIYAPLIILAVVIVAGML